MYGTTGGFRSTVSRYSRSPCRSACACVATYASSELNTRFEKPGSRSVDATVRNTRESTARRNAAVPTQHVVDSSQTSAAKSAGLMQDSRDDNGRSTPRMVLTGSCAPRAPTRPHRCPLRSSDVMRPRYSTHRVRLGAAAIVVGLLLLPTVAAAADDRSRLADVVASPPREHSPFTSSDSFCAPERLKTPGHRLASAPGVTARSITVAFLTPPAATETDPTAPADPATAIRTSATW